nr:VTT domain-containing protein [Candidatus Binatus sp.]
MNRRSLIIRLILVATLVAAIVWLALHREFLQATTLERELQRFGRFAPILFVLLYALATVLFVPGSLLTVAGGALFGPVAGTLWNLIGATLGATLAFMIARYVASDWVSMRAGERLARLMRGVEEEGWRFVAFVRLVPLFPFNIVNYAFGLTRIGLGEYVLASFACMMPGALAYTYLGYAGREAASGQAGAIHKALLALALLATVAFLPRLVRKLKGPRFTDAPTLRHRLQNGEAVALIDVRSAEEFRGPLGHIAGARNIALAELSARLPDLSDLRGKPMITI